VDCRRSSKFEIPSKLACCGLILLGLAACSSSPKGRGDKDAMSAAAKDYIVRPVGLLVIDFDTDTNAFTTRQEFDAGISFSFANADTNNNGALSELEFVSWSERVLGTRNPVHPGFLPLDQNQDRALSFDEYARGLEHAFSVLDENKDDQIDRSELVSVFTVPTASGQRSARGIGGGKGRGEGRRRGSPYGFI